MKPHQKKELNEVIHDFLEKGNINDLDFKEEGNHTYKIALGRHDFPTSQQSALFNDLKDIYE